MRRLLLYLFILFFGFTGSAGAAIVTINWTGQVDSISGSASSIASVGDIFTVISTYDTDGVDIYPEIERFRALNSSTLIFEINEYIFESESIITPADEGVGISNNVGSNEDDFLQFWSDTATQRNGSAPGSYMTLALGARDEDGTIFSTADYLPDNIDTSQFEIVLFSLNAYDDNDTPVAGIQGSAISVVPVPAAAWLLGSGLIGLVGIRRRLQK